MENYYGLFLIAVGLFALICTFLKPDFYWNSRKATRMRRLIGDFGASLLYYLIGGVVTVIGTLILLGVIQQ